MRIHGNRLLKTLPGRETRPTTARVREALFNIWQTRVVGCRWLDLCAGNGAMGAEALCRQAKLVWGIEKSSRACKIIRENWQEIAQSDQEYQVIKGDVRVKLKSLGKEKFDCIYFDPPYHESNLYKVVLDLLSEYQILHSDGEIAVEHDAKLKDSLECSGLKKIRTKAYGSTGLTFYSYED